MQLGLPEAMHADWGGGLTGSYLALGLHPPPSSVLAHLSNSPQLIRKELFYQLHLSEWRRIFNRKSFVDKIFFLRRASVVSAINVPLSQPVASGYDLQFKDLRNYFQVLTMSYLC
jgi:hypothetical protein